MVGDLAKTNNNAIPTIYDGSILTKLMKEYVGANALCLGLFTLQNNNFVFILNSGNFAVDFQVTTSLQIYGF